MSRRARSHDRRVLGEQFRASGGLLSRVARWLSSVCTRASLLDTLDVLHPEKSPQKRYREHGYSLLEVLIVLTIIALIAALVGPRLMAQLDRSKVTAARVQIRALSAAVETLRLDLGRYPTDEEGLALLVQSPQSDDADLWRGPYIDAETPVDPWGGAYVYEAPREDFARPRISSLGADGEVGGEGLAADIAYGDEP